MKRLDLKSSAVAGLAGAVLLVLVVRLFDYIENTSPPLYPTAGVGTWALFGFIVGFSVQAAERLTGAS